MAQIGSVTAVLDADTAGFTGGVGQAIDSLGSLSQMLGTTRGAIATMTAAAAAAAAGGLAAATAQAAKFERTIAGAAARAGATSEAFNMFGQAAKQASLDSAFGANEAGKALRFLAKSGFEAEQATAALPGILEGATAAGTSTAEMGRIVSDALRAFGRSASETTDVMDVLVKGATSANTSVQELGKGISIVGGLAREAGMSIESVTAIMASMQNAGVGASRAAVAMRAGISRLLKPTGEAEATLKRLGVNTKDAEGNFKGLVPVLTELEKAGASSSDMLAVFGRRAGPTLQTALSKGAGAIKSFRGQLENAEGTTERISSFIESSFTEQVKILWGSIKTLGANIGSLLLPVLKATVPIMRGVVEGLNFFANAIKGALIPLGELTTILEPAETKFGDVGSAMKEGSESAGQAAEKTGQLATQQSSMASAAGRAASEQSRLNKEVKEFQNLDLKGKRKAFDRLVNDAEDARKQLEQLRSRREQVAGAFANLPQTGNVSIEQADPASATGEAKELINQYEGLNGAISAMENKLKKVEGRISESADAQLKMTESEQKQLKALEKQGQILRADSKIRKERLRLQKRIAEIQSKEGVPAEVKTQQVENARIKANKKIAELKKKQAERGKEAIQSVKSAFKGPLGAIANTAGTAAASMTGGGGDFSRAKSEMKQHSARAKNFANAKEQMQQHSAAAKKSAEETTKAKDAQSSAIKNAKTLTSSVGSLASALAEASGASKQATKGISAASSALQSVLGGIAQGGPVGIASGIIGGVTSLVKGIAGGGTTKNADRRDQRRFADILAKRMGEEMEARNLRPVEVSVAGRSRGTQSGPSGDSPREFNRKVEEAEALQGVGLGG